MTKHTQARFLAKVKASTHLAIRRVLGGEWSDAKGNEWAQAVLALGRQRGVQEWEVLGAMRAACDEAGVEFMVGQPTRAPDTAGGTLEWVRGVAQWVASGGLDSLASNADDATAARRLAAVLEGGCELADALRRFVVRR